ncbi:leucine-rich repeat domain-containing protein [Clostridiaceae bacterium M8S5]|nr:leucine-rich repeat domain-containing protein [Clostridiaceae bacterium M8S5]
MKNKTAVFFMIVFMIITCKSVKAESEWKVKLDNKEMEIFHPVIEHNQKVYLPVSDTLKLLKFEVKLTNQDFLVSRDDINRKFYIDEDYITDERYTKYDYLYNVELYAEAKFFEENMLCKVVFDQEKKEVLIDTDYEKLYSMIANLRYNSNYFEIDSIHTEKLVTEDDKYYNNTNSKTYCNIIGYNKTGRFNPVFLKNLDGQVKLDKKGLDIVKSYYFRDGMAGIKMIANGEKPVYSESDSIYIDRDVDNMTAFKGFDQLPIYDIEMFKLDLINYINKEKLVIKYEKTGSDKHIYKITTYDASIYYELIFDTRIQENESREFKADIIIEIDEKNRIQQIKIDYQDKDEYREIKYKDKHIFSYKKVPLSFRTTLNKLKKEVYASTFEEIDTEKIAEFKDKALEKSIRQLINKPQGDLYIYDCLSIGELIYNGYERLKYLDGIENLQNLRTLILYDNDIVDVSKLATIKRLEFLDLTNNKIANISVLNENINLNHLYLDNNGIKDMPSLNKLNNLRYLSLTNNEISDLTFLEGMKNSDIERLYLEHNNIKDLKPIENLMNLTELYLMNNNIEDLSGLKDIEYLKVLNLNDNNISDISPIKNVETAYLFLNNNKIMNINELNLKETYILSIDNNKIKNINHSLFDHTKLLMILSIKNNKINDWEFLSKLEHLYKINVLGNEIDDETITKYNNVFVY